MVRPPSHRLLLVLLLVAFALLASGSATAASIIVTGGTASFVSTGMYDTGACRPLPVLQDSEPVAAARRS